MAGKSIAGIGTAVPDHKLSLQNTLDAGAAWLAGRPAELALFSRFAVSSQIQNRHIAFRTEEILGLNGYPSRLERFHEVGLTLAERAINAALKDAGLTVKDVGTIIFTSCTAPSIPSLDTRVIDKLGFSRSTRRVPIYQYGCLGGAAGLALALHTDSEGLASLLLSVELCSLLHLKQDSDRSNLVGSALFADGAACVVLNESQRGLRVLGSRSNLLPNSSHLMGYDLRDDGTHLILDRELPSCLAEHVPELVRRFLDEHDIPQNAVRSWLLHPGGPKILLALEKLLDIEREQSIASWHVLQQFGNMSSASLLFVLQNALASPNLRRGDYCIMLGIGPGLCVELVALQLQ